MGGVGLPDTLQLHAWKTHGTFLQPLRVHDSHLLFFTKGVAEITTVTTKKHRKVEVWRCFVYNGGLVIFCIYTFCFFLTSSSLAEFCHGGWTDESSWSTFDRINRTEALSFLWEGKSVGPSCRTAELYQLISQMFDIYDHICNIYRPSGLRYILHEYKNFTVYL